MFEKSVTRCPAGGAGREEPPVATAAEARRGTLLVSLAVFGIMVGQQMINPVLGPLTRELGFSEWQLGPVMTVGAAGVVLASPIWGPARGSRPSSRT